MARRGTGSKVMAVADGASFPVAVRVTNASPHDITLVAATSKAGFSTRFPGD